MNLRPDLMMLAVVAAGATMLAIVVMVRWPRQVCAAIGGAIVGAAIGGTLEESETSTVVAGAVIGAFSGLFVCLLLKHELLAALLEYARESIRVSQWHGAVEKNALSRRTVSGIWNLTASAMAASTFAGLLMIDPKSLWTNIVGEFDNWHATLVVLILVGLGACFLVPLHELLLRGREEEHSSEANEHESGRSMRLLTTVRFVFAVAVLAALEPLQTGFHEMMNREFSTTLQVTIVNCISAGVATYYWGWAAQLRVPSIARTCFRAATAFGAVIVTPWAGLIAGLLLFGRVSKDNLLFYFFIGILLTLAIAILISVITFGLTALAGALAIEHRWLRPVTITITASLILFGLLQYGICLLVVSAIAHWESIPLPDGIPIWPTVVCACGWGVGLALNPNTEKLLK